jgi:hypothetical protein
MEAADACSVSELHLGRNNGGACCFGQCCITGFCSGRPAKHVPRAPYRWRHSRWVQCADRRASSAASSVFSPGETGGLGLVQGPTAQPLPLQVSFRSQSEKSAARPTVRTISAAPAAVVLFQNQAAGPTIWESAFDCTATDGPALEDPLAFVQTASPPALSLLMSEAEDGDVRMQEGLAELRRQCGSDVPTQLTMARFGLADLVTPEWPSRLPVRCPS